MTAIVKVRGVYKTWPIQSSLYTNYICDVQTQVSLTGLLCQLSISKDLWLKLVCNRHLFSEGRLLLLYCLVKLHLIWGINGVGMRWLHALRNAYSTGYLVYSKTYSGKFQEACINSVSL